MVSGSFLIRMITEEARISRQRILILPEAVVTSASSPTPTVRLLMVARRRLAGPPSALSWN